MDGRVASPAAGLRWASLAGGREMLAWWCAPVPYGSDRLCVSIFLCGVLSGPRLQLGGAVLQRPILDAQRVHLRQEHLVLAHLFLEVEPRLHRHSHRSVIQV